MKQNKKIWLKAGYSEFAQSKPGGLKVEKLAQLVGKSRSSFYHLFGDMEGFEDELLVYHEKQSQNVAKDISSAISLIPDFGNILHQHKDWAFCHMQLFHHQNDSSKFGEAFNEINKLIEPQIGRLWIKTLNLDEMPQEKTQALYLVLRDTIFSRLNYNTYSVEIFEKEINRLNNSIQNLLNGAVAQ